MLYYDSISRINSDKELIHSPHVAKLYDADCGLTDCTGNSPETVFSLRKLLESCVSYIVYIALLFSLLSLLKRLPSGIKEINLRQNQD